jgi:outer membrane murein-binding lipoprotein Lpp
MKTIIKTLQNRIDALEIELKAMRRTLGAAVEKKYPKAWDRLHLVGKEITRDWKSDKPSWQLISESKR